MSEHDWNDQEETAPIDWGAIRQRLEWDSSADQQTILDRRTEQYARPTQSDYTPTDSLPMLIFRLGDETYGIDVTLVRTVRQLPKLVSVPGVPDFYRGVVNLRGKIITVLDLRRYFELTIIEDDTGAELIVTEANELEIGLLASRVEGIRSIVLGSVQPVEHMRYTRGVTTDRVVVLDLEQLFGDESLIVGSSDI